MGKDHLLVKKAFIYSQRERLENPENSMYDNALGVWLWGDKKEVLVKSVNPFRPKCGTKKADIETGEDVKGE